MILSMQMDHYTTLNKVLNKGGKMLIRRVYDDVNRTDKFITEEIEKTKKNWLKSDKEKLKQLKIKSEELKKEKYKTFEKYMKIDNQYDKIEKQIKLINKKYTYIQKVKKKNPNYNKYINDEDNYTA